MSNTLSTESPCAACAYAYAYAYVASVNRHKQHMKRQHT